MKMKMAVRRRYLRFLLPALALLILLAFLLLAICCASPRSSASCPWMG